MHEHIVRDDPKAKTPTIVYNIVNVIVWNFAYKPSKSILEMVGGIEGMYVFTIILYIYIYRDMLF